MTGKERLPSLREGSEELTEIVIIIFSTFLCFFLSKKEDVLFSPLRYFYFILFRRVIGGVCKDSVFVLHISEEAGEVSDEDIFRSETGHEAEDVVHTLGALAV